MKRTFSLRPFAAIALSWLALTAQAQEPGSRWHLRVMDQHRLVKVEATVRFTDEPARSCMGGDWKRVIVESRDAEAEAFFPLKEPLAYTFENGKLTLGRTEACDNYLFLSGQYGIAMVTGSYDRVGWGRERLGSFALGRIRD